MGEPKIERSVAETTSLRVGYLLLLNGNMSQKELALGLGLTPGQLNHKMVGRSKWGVSEMIALGDFFGVPFDYLIGRLPIESAEPVNAKTPAEAGVEAVDESAPSRDRTYDLRIKSP